MCRFNWVVLSSGNRDLLHVALATATYSGWYLPHIKRFDGTPDRRETLLKYLDTKRQEDGDESLDLVMHDRMRFGRFNRFSVPTYFYLEAYVKFMQINPDRYRSKDILVLSTQSIIRKDGERELHAAWFGNVKIEDLTTCAFILNPIGAGKLHEALTTGSELPKMYFIPEPILEEYRWDYGEGCYD